MKVLHEVLRNTCEYDKTTGVFKRVLRKTWAGNWVVCDSTPKSVTPWGYLQMSFQGRPYLVHRLIFLWVNGEFPAGDVDHINGDRLDNRWENLRLVSRQDNLRNMGIRDSNQSGCTGVSFAKDRGKFHAYIGVGDGERLSLGHFKTLDEATAARKAAEVVFEYHPNHGTRPSWRE